MTRVVIISGTGCGSSSSSGTCCKLVNWSIIMRLDCNSFLFIFFLFMLVFLFCCFLLLLLHFYPQIALEFCDCCCYLRLAWLWQLVTLTVDLSVCLSNRPSIIAIAVNSRFNRILNASINFVMFCPYAPLHCVVMCLWLDVALTTLHWQHQQTIKFLCISLKLPAACCLLPSCHGMQMRLANRLTCGGAFWSRPLHLPTIAWA